MDSSENSTTLLGMPTHLDRSSFTGTGPHSCRLVSLLRCRLVTRVTFRQLQLRAPLSNQLSSRVPLPHPVMPRSQVQNPLSGFVPKQTKESSAWRATYIVLQFTIFLYLNFFFKSRKFGSLIFFKHCLIWSQY